MKTATDFGRNHLTRGYLFRYKIIVLLPKRYDFLLYDEEKSEENTEKNRFNKRKKEEKLLRERRTCYKGRVKRASRYLSGGFGGRLAGLELRQNVGEGRVGRPGTVNLQQTNSIIIIII